jgi:hypothetical protein
MLVPLLKTLQFGTTAACFKWKELLIRVYDLIPGLSVNDPCVTKTDEQLSIVMSKPLVSNQVEGDCAEHLFGFSPSFRGIFEDWGRKNVMRTEYWSTA